MWCGRGWFSAVLSACTRHCRSISIFIAQPARMDSNSYHAYITHKQTKAHMDIDTQVCAQTGTHTCSQKLSECIGFGSHRFPGSLIGQKDSCKTPKTPLPFPGLSITQSVGIFITTEGQFLNRKQARWEHCLKGNFSLKNFISESKVANRWG